MDAACRGIHPQGVELGLGMGRKGGVLVKVYVALLGGIPQRLERVVGSTPGALLVPTLLVKCQCRT